MQEIKAKDEQFPTELINYSSRKGYYIYTNSAEKPGYAGVTVLSKKPALKVTKIMGHERFDSEGRMIELEFENFRLINFYLPHGGRMKENLDYKITAYNNIFKKISKFKGGNIIIAGDFNIAHTDLDLARPKENLNNIMFTPTERKLIDRIITLGFYDTFRLKNKDNRDYTWFPYAFNARERNLGWRIDYIFVQGFLKETISKAFTKKDVPGSDHIPIGIEF